jgi:hypothetical protein
MGKPVTVVRSGKQWGVRVTGKPAQNSQHHTQKAAIKKAIPIAKREKLDLTIQGRNHEFREKNSYGHDPYQPAG